MKAKELLSILISIEDNLSVEYDKFCIGDITREVYQKKSEQCIQKQINLIEQFGKEVEQNKCKKCRYNFEDKNKPSPYHDVEKYYNTED